nr:ribonuclease H-like domain-containing protein [Tanacetum cinerariifolium]
MDVEIEHDDLNQKFLTSLALEWLMHTIVWRNRSDLDTMSLDDLNNHLKVYKSEVQKKLEPKSLNMAFISLTKHISGNEDGNIACVPTASANVPTASASVIDEDDMEEMDIKWNMALLSMRADKFWKKTGKKISIQRSDVAGFDKSKVECLSCHRMGYFARECRAPRSQDRRRRDNYRQGSKAKERAPKVLMAIDGVFDNSLCSKDCKKNNDSLNRKFEQWQFQIQQYLLHEHYALWEVIEFGDSYEVPASTASTTTTDTISGETGTPTEPHHTPSPEATSSHLTTSSIPLPSIPTAPIPTVTPTDTTPLYNTPEEQGLLRTSKYWGVLRILMISLRLIPLVSEGYVTMKACYSEQKTHEFIPVYLAFASVYVWIGNTIMARLQFCDYHNMVAILKKSEHNVDFHPMIDFIEASRLMYALTVKPTVYVSHIRQFWSTARIETTEEGTKILATVDGIHRTVTESSLRRNLKLRDEEGISSLPDMELFENLTLMGYNISPNQKFTFQKDEPESPLRDVSQGEACPTDSGFIADQDRATIAKSSTLLHDSAPRVTSPAADEGSMQHTINELTALCTSLQRQHSELLAKFQAQEVEINRLKERVKLLEAKEGVAAERSGDDAPIKGRSLDEGEAAAERTSDDIEEMATVLTSMDTATVLASRAATVPTGSGSIPTAGPPAVEVPTGSDVVPTASLVFATATIVTPYKRRKGKEFMVESETLKKQKVQEQIDNQVARELEEQLEREDQRRSEQIA